MKKITSLLIFAFFLQFAAAQKMGFFSGGVSLLVGWDKYSRNATILPSFTAAPGVKFVQKCDFTVLAQLPLSFGFSFQDVENDKPITYAGLDVPITCNFLFGSGFGNKSKAKFGFMVGGGPGYHVSQNEIYSSDGIEKHHLRFTGLLVNTGLLFPFGKQNGDGGIMVRMSWLGNMQTSKKML